MLAKMAIDQLIFTPAGTVVFYSAFKTMEGDAAGIPATLREKFIPTLLAGYALWPLVHIINFRYVCHFSAMLLQVTLSWTELSGVHVQVCQQ